MVRRLILVALFLATACARERPRYNVLLVTLDTTRADHIGKATPAITSIATGGIRFANADSPVPLTLPEVFNLLNADNPAAYVGDVATSLYGQPTTFAGDPLQGEQRLIQLGARVRF